MNLMLNPHKRFYFIVGFLLLAAIIPLTVFIAQKRQDIRQRASETQTAFFFSTDNCTTPVTTLNMTPNTQTNLSLCLNTKGNPISGFSVAASIGGNLFSNAQIDLAEGTTAQQFNTEFVSTYDIHTGALQYQRAIGLSQEPVIANNLLLKTYRISANGPATGSINITRGSALTLDPSIASGKLSAETPALTYTISNAVPTNNTTPTTPLSPTIEPTGITPTVTGTVPTLTVIPTATTAPTATPVPTCPPPVLPTATANTTQFEFTVTLPSVGTAGNINPKTCTRTIIVQIFDSQNIQQGQDMESTIAYDSSSATFKGFINAGNLAAGSYFMNITVAKSPKKLVPGFITLSESRTVPVSVSIRKVGNINTQGDSADSIDTMDYNTLLSCYGNRAGSSSCPNKTLADLDDNGVVDGADYNILLRSRSVVSGD